MSESPSSRWNRIRNQHLNFKMNETESPTLSNFHAVSLSTGFTRLIFLGNKPNKSSKSQRELNLMYVDIDPLYRSHDSTTWEPLLTDYVPKPDELKTNMQEDLLHERKRLMNNNGITTYQVTDNRILFAFGKTGQLQYADLSDKSPLPRKSITGNSARTDPKLCPGNVDLMAFFREGDLWLQDISMEEFSEVRLTNEAQHGQRIFAGFPSYIILEEFDRYSGFFWQPGNKGSKQRIAYEGKDLKSHDEM